MTLAYTDHRADPAAWARALNVSTEACTLLLDAHVIDLHCDLELPTRLLGYDLARHHGPQRRVRPLFGHTDLPRLREAAFTGVVLDLVTNPLRPRRSREAVLQRNLARLRARLDAHPDHIAIVRGRSDYEQAVGQGKLACWIAVQGGNGFGNDLSALERIPDRLISRVTLVHLTSSHLGGTNSPLGRDRGLSPFGRDFVRACNAQRILVDLSHIGPRSFWHALDAHTPDLPPIVTHTGVKGRHAHWRNLDDDQVRAIADRGGVIGILYHSAFLQPVLYAGQRAAVLDHLQYLCDLVGDTVPALGTDYDGFIVPPADLTLSDHPRLVQDMLNRGWSEARIRRILGENALRAIGEIRGF